MRRAVGVQYPSRQVFDVALQTGPARRQVVQFGALARPDDGAPGARHSQPLIAPQCLVELVRQARDQFRKNAAVLDPHRRALRQKGQPCVRRVAEQGHPAFRPSQQWLAVEQSPFEIAVAAFKEPQQLFIRAGIRRQQFVAVGLADPGFLGPLFGVVDRDEVHHFAAPHIIMNDVPVRPHPIQ